MISLSTLFSCKIGVENDIDGLYENWDSYLGDNARTHYSTLDQINKSNIKELELIWTYHSGDARADNRSQIQCSPIVINDILYGTNPSLKLFAINGTTGEELWQFNPTDSVSTRTGCKSWCTALAG